MIVARWPSRASARRRPPRGEAISRSRRWTGRRAAAAASDRPPSSRHGDPLHGATSVGRCDGRAAARRREVGREARCRPTRGRLPWGDATAVPAHRSSRCWPRPRTRCPEGDGWLFEPKWDGFRALVFRDGDETFIQSRDLKPLDRYFPELAAPLRASLPDRCVLDGEVVIAADGALQFEALLLRIHPAESRVRMLAEQSPAIVRRLGPAGARRRGPRAVPQGERRARLEVALRGARAADPPDARDDRSRTRGRLVRPVRGGRPRWRRREAARWHVPARQAGDDQDQAPAHRRLCRRRLPLAQERAGHARRIAAARAVRRRGDAAPRRRHVVVHLGSPRRAGQGARAAPDDALEGHPWPEWAEWAAGAPRHRASGMPGATSRWNRGKDLSWEPLRPSASRRSPTTTSRATGSATGRRSCGGARTSEPEDCRYDQLEETAAFELERIFGAA